MRSPVLETTVAGFDVLRGVASATPKEPGSSQDHAQVFGSDTSGPRGVVVCDGVGSLTGSGLVAEQAVSAAVRCLGNGVDFPGDLFGMTDTVGSSLRHLAGLGATTMIALGALGSTGQVAYSYVGNGALLEIAGLDLGNGRTRLLWVNHLLPHSGIERGRDALSSWLPPDEALAATASNGWMNIPTGATRLFLVCTDGLLTEEDRKVGKSADGSMWEEIPGPLATILVAVESAWRCLDPLPGLLQDTLERLAADGQLEDDATIGAVLLRPRPAGDATP